VAKKGNVEEEETGAIMLSRDHEKGGEKKAGNIPAI